MDSPQTAGKQFRSLETTDRGELLDYIAPVAATIIATLVRLALEPIVGSAVPFGTYFAATIIVAWYRGFWPSAVTVALSIFAGAYYVLPRVGVDSLFGRTASATIAGFTLLGLAVSFLIDFQHRTMIRARKAETLQASIAMENARLLENTKRSEEGLRIANEELTRANRDLETFAYSASHDLREPLRTISLSAQIIERDSRKALTADALRFLDQIKTSALRMDTLLDDLLTYSRVTKIDGGAPKADASRVLTGVLENLRSQLEGAEAQIEADPLPMLEIHESSLALVFQNLISNAVKYRGKEAPRVHIAVQQQNGDFVFSVADNGLGIDEQFSEQIFNLFSRLHTKDHYPGNGMGLAICRRVVEQYGGRIWLEHSELKRGSTFCFSIPRKA